MTDLARIERDKYERVWAECPAYKRHSPGLRHAPEAYGWFCMTGCASLIDFGCGDGRALRWFADQPEAQRVHGIDIAHEGVDIDRHCLWDPIPAGLHTDFGFSCDVLEHIPTEHVDACVRNMAEAVRTAAWVQVALFDDTAGTQGDWGPLHLTVKPKSWWAHCFDRYFKVVYGVERQGRATFLLLKAPPRLMVA